LKFYVNETYEAETETRPRRSRPRLQPCYTSGTGVATYDFHRPISFSSGFMGDAAVTI